MTAFALQVEEFIVSTEIGCPTNPKIFYYVAPFRLRIMFVYVSHVSLCVGVECVSATLSLPLSPVLIKLKLVMQSL